MFKAECFGFFGGFLDFKHSHGLIVDVMVRVNRKSLRRNGLDTTKVHDTRDWNNIEAWARETARKHNRPFNNFCDARFGLTILFCITVLSAPSINKNNHTVFRRCGKREAADKALVKESSLIMHFLFFPKLPRALARHLNF